MPNDFPSPRILETCFWEITLECNLRCVHCISSAGDRRPLELDTTEALGVVEELVTAGCRTVNLTGGEPLVREDWPDLARSLTSCGVDVVLASNGLLIDAATIAEMVSCGVQGISISLDGKRSVHDRIRQPTANGSSISRYDAAIRALKLLVVSPLRTAVITQIHRANVDDLAEMYAQIADLGVELWQVQLAIPSGRLVELAYDYVVEPAWLPQITDELAVLVSDGRTRISVADNIGYFDRHEPLIRGSAFGRKGLWRGCQAGCSSLGICANGNVKGCLSFPEEFVVGNLHEQSLASIWSDPDNFAYNTCWRDEDLVGECARCSFRRLCRAGCTSMAYAVTGTVHDNPFCVRRASSGTRR